MHINILSSCVLLILLNTITYSVAQFKRFCYYTPWGLYTKREAALAPEKLDPFFCTDILVAFATLDDKGLQMIKPEGFWNFDVEEKLLEIRKLNNRINIILALGGWDHSSVSFHKLMSSKENMQYFAEEAIRFIRRYDFDGLDIDWQYPSRRGSTDEDKYNFYYFLRLMYDMFMKEEHPDPKWKLQLSITVNPIIKDANDFYYDLPEYARHVNYVNLKCYDLHGTFERPMRARHHSALKGHRDPLNTNNLVRYWVGRGVPAEKTVIGISFVGKSYRLADRYDNLPGAPAIDKGFAGDKSYPYNKMCRLLKHGNHAKMDAETGVPYLVRGDEWIGFDTPETVRQKAAIARNNHLAGVSVWSLNADDYDGKCGKKYPMMNGIIDGLDERHAMNQQATGAHQDYAQHKRVTAELRRQREVGWNLEDKQWKLRQSQKASHRHHRL